MSKVFTEKEIENLQAACEAIIKDECTRLYTIVDDIKNGKLEDIEGIPEFIKDNAEYGLVFMYVIESIIAWYRLFDHKTINDLIYLAKKINENKKATKK